MYEENFDNILFDSLIESYGLYLELIKLWENLRETFDRIS